MSLILRLLRGCWAFGFIFADYVIQIGLAQVFHRTVVSDPHQCCRGQMRNV